MTKLQSSAPVSTNSKRKSSQMFSVCIFVHFCSHLFTYPVQNLSCLGFKHGFITSETTSVSQTFYDLVQELVCS